MKCFRRLKEVRIKLKIKLLYCINNRLTITYYLNYFCDYFLTVPIVYPENFVAVNISSSRISMSWEAIDIEDSNGILQGYHIYYREALLNGSWNNVSATNLTGDIPVLGLRSYEIKICGYTRVGDGVISPITVVNSTGHG